MTEGTRKMCEGYFILKPFGENDVKGDTDSVNLYDVRGSNRCILALVVFDEAQLRRVLKNYASYYNQVRTHLSLHKNAPHFRCPQKLGYIASIPILGGLHHQYVRV